MDNWEISHFQSEGEARSKYASWTQLPHFHTVIPLSASLSPSPRKAGKYVYVCGWEGYVSKIQQLGR